jgi:hypothetical protein
VQAKCLSIRPGSLGILEDREDFQKLLKGSNLLQNMKLLVLKKCKSSRKKKRKKLMSTWKVFARNTKV